MIDYFNLKGRTFVRKVDGQSYTVDKVITNIGEDKKPVMSILLKADGKPDVTLTRSELEADWEIN